MKKYKLKWFKNHHKTANSESCEACWIEGKHYSWYVWDPYSRRKQRCLSFDIGSETTFLLKKSIRKQSLKIQPNKTQVWNRKAFLIWTKSEGVEESGFRVDRRPRTETERGATSFLKAWRLRREKTNSRTNSSVVLLFKGGNVAMGFLLSHWDHGCVPSNCGIAEVNPRTLLKICRSKIICSLQYQFVAFSNHTTWTMWDFHLLRA